MSSALATRVWIPSGRIGRRNPRARLAKPFSAQFAPSIRNPSVPKNQMHLKNGRSCPPHAGAKRLSVHGALPPPESCPSPQSCAFRARCSANGSSVRFVIANRALPGGLAISGNAGPPFELDAALGIKRVNRHADRRRDAMLVFARPNSLAEYRKHQLTEMVNHPSKTADQTRAERTGPQIAQGTRQGGRFHESTPAG